ncbi:efflux RND transporter permease subunit [Planktotalea sp.]|uniref:efflux RND transporter permease subunit n=1 Tax=Planktotalea sp. TaxID=2029877 RepID=UPI003F6C6C5E
MALGIGFGAERIGLLVLRWPKIAATMLFALALLIAVSLPNLRFENDIHGAFFSDSELSQAQLNYRAEQKSDISTVLIHLQSERAFSSQDVSDLRDLALDLEFLDGVESVISPFALRFSPSDTAPNGAPVFGTEISEKYNDDLSRFRALRTGLPTFLNGSQTTMLVGVRVDMNVAEIGAILPQLQAEVVAAVPSHVIAHITGEEVISHEIVTGLKSDLIRLNLWGALLVGFAALVLLRDLKMVLLAVIPALLSAASVLALSVWLGHPITVLSNVIPILLLVLGVADGVHLAGHLKTTGDSPRETILRIGPACALTAITTALAFTSIMVTRNAQLFDFAVLGGLGTLLAFVVTISTFAILAIFMRPSVGAAPRFTGVFAQQLSRISLAAPKTFIVSGALLLVCSVYGFQQTKAWFPLYQNLPSGSETVQVNDAISDDFGGVFQMIVEMEGDWAESEVVVDALTDLAGNEAVLSTVNVARWLGIEGRPTSDELALVPDEVLAQLRPDEDITRIFVSVPEPMRSADAAILFDTLYDTAKAGGAARIYGLPSLMRQEAVSLISQLSLGLVIASLGATFVVALAFGSLRLFPLLLVPNVLPLMVTGASLHLWASGQLSPTAVLALTISFGIAIDDSVHFLNRFFEARARGDSPHAAVLSATGSAGQIMVLTTVLLTFGLAITMISGFFPIRLFGGMMIITLWAALLFDLLLLPALLTARGSKI